MVWRLETRLVRLWSLRFSPVFSRFMVDSIDYFLVLVRLTLSWVGVLFLASFTDSRRLLGETDVRLGPFFVTGGSCLV